MDVIYLRVVDIQKEATDTVTIFLSPRDGSTLQYRAGQFLTFIFTFHGREVRRSYSLSSTPGVDAVATITVRRVDNGEVSRYLIDHLKVGDILLSLPPAGKFLLDESDGRPLVFIAAGSGLVPVYSLVKAAMRGAQKVVLVTQNRNVDSILFLSSLERMALEMPERFQWINVLSDRQQVAGAISGVRLSNNLLTELLEEVLAELDSPRFYLCGPTGFMRMVIFTLRIMGIPAGEIRRENFVVEFVPPPPVLPDTDPKLVVIYAGDDRLEFATRWPSTILQSALDNGIALPYSCKGGRCSTCVARCVSGKVKMSINEVLTDKDLEAGLILTCVGFAETDIELSYGV